MIHIDEKKDRVKMHGDIATLMFEVSIVINKLYEMLLEGSDEETAKEGIVLVGRLGMDMAEEEERGM